MIHVTMHAAERYVERIDGSVTLDEAIARIATSGKAIEAAAAFGCPSVIRSDGAKLVLDGTRVVTVVGRRNFVMANRPVRFRGGVL